MSEFEVEAFIFDKKIGNILLKDGVVYFEYDKVFQTSTLEISPLKLPLSLKGVYTNNDDKYFEGLPGVFHDTLPDKFGTKVIERYFESKNIPPHELNVIQKLMFIGDKSIGAITYKPIIHKLDEQKINELIELQNFYDNAKKIVSGDAIEVVDEMLSFMDSAASAGGARAKAIIGYNQISKEMISGVKKDLKEGFEHYLIKFDIAKDDNSSSDYTKIEYLYMTMAKEAGINVPEIELLLHKNLAHYLIKRFDRADGEVFHLHSVAGLTHSNFNIPMHYSYDELLRLTRYLTGNQSAVNEQFKRMVFNIVGRNQDDHAKNFSFIMNEDGVWNISPAYDITYAYGSGYTKEHQMSINAKTSNINLEDLYKIADIVDIPQKEVNLIVENIGDKFLEFKKRALNLGIDKNLIEDINKNIRWNIIKKDKNVFV